MTASLFGWLGHQHWYVALGTFLSLPAMIAITATAWGIWQRRCRVRFCVRASEMPVSGTPWKTCHHHGRVLWHGLLRAEFAELPDSGEYVVWP